MVKIRALEAPQSSPVWPGKAQAEVARAGRVARDTRCTQTTPTDSYEWISF